MSFGFELRIDMKGSSIIKRYFVIKSGLNLQF